MRTRNILAKAVGSISFLFAAFGNFLLDVAPPEEADAKFAVGISSLLALGLLLFISALSRNRQRTRFRKVWLVAAGSLFGVAIISGCIYKWNIDHRTFPYPPENQKVEYIAGTKLTPEAEAYWAKNKSLTAARIVAEFGGIANRELVWTRDSIFKAKIILMINYIVVVLSFAGMFFCLTEGLLAVPERKDF